MKCAKIVIALFASFIVFICFVKSGNNITPVPVSLNSNTLTVVQKPTLKNFEFYSIYSYFPYHSKEFSEHNSNEIFYTVLYEFTEFFYDFTIYSNDLDYTENLFENYNIFIFLTLSDYSFTLDTNGIQFIDGNEERLNINLIEDVHKNSYNNGISDPIYMQPEYHGGIVLLPKQYILKDVNFNINRVNDCIEYKCDKYYGRDIANISSETLLTYDLCKKYNFKEFSNRYLYKGTK